MENKEQKESSRYSRKYGFPYLTIDYIEIEKNIEYEINIKCEKKNYEYDFFPEIEVPSYLGYIRTKELAVNAYGKKSNTMPILVCKVDMDNPETVVQYASELGGIKISFCCKYHQKEMGPKCITTVHGDTGHAVKMIKEKISDNKVRYICRAPYETEKDNLIFTVEWEKINE